MKVGDLVKYKWITMAQKRRAEHFGRNPNAVGVIIDELDLKRGDGKTKRLLVKFADMPQPLKVYYLNLEKVVC